MWFLDSGCSNHMYGYKYMFQGIEDCKKGYVKCGNNSKMKVSYKGNLKLKFNSVVLNVQDVYYVPDLRYNQLSVWHIQEKGAILLICNVICRIYHPKRGVIVQSKMNENRMFALINEHSKPSTQNNEECLHTSPDFTHLWHQRYGYFGYKGLKLLQTKNMVHGLPHLDIPNITCVECLSGK